MSTQTKEMVKKVSDTLSGNRRGVDSNKLLVDIMERWGGTAQFAKDVVGEYNTAAKGSLQRTKLLEMLQKLVVTNSIHGITQTERPEDLETDEIEEAIQGYILRVVKAVVAKEDADTRAPTAAQPPEDWEEEPPPNFR